MAKFFMFTVWLHVPVGILNAAMLYFSPPLGVLFGAGFCAYEITQGGKPWYDIKGWLWGLGGAALIWFILYVFTPDFIGAGS